MHIGLNWSFVCSTSHLGYAVRKLSKMHCVNWGDWRRTGGDTILFNFGLLVFYSFWSF